ncbi:hypothetical protein ACKKBF_B00385 [Auxenochlorella protothecoides x Auxenochlorella symbiontica]
MVLKVGILGGANIANKISRAINSIPDVAQVVVVGSREASKAASFIERNKLVHASPVAGYDAVLDFPGVEAVYIPLPTALHVEWVQKAASKGLHIVLEKPIAIEDEHVDAIVKAAADANVVLFDGTMWMHHPRTAAMEAALQEIGPVWDVDSAFTFKGSADFLENNVRVKADGDPLGALGDVGWYCVRAILWAYDFTPPTHVAAHHGALFNEAGVPLNIAATLLFPGGRKARFLAAFDTVFTSKLEVYGDRGSLRLRDFVIPTAEHEASFVMATANGLADGDTRIATVEETRTVRNAVTQEAALWQRFAREIEVVRAGGRAPEYWPRIAALTERVLSAVLASARQGCALLPFEHRA